MACGCILKFLTDCIILRMKDKKKIELVKCQTLLRYDDQERLEIYNDFYEILKKHKFTEHTRIPTHALMDFL